MKLKHLAKQVIEEKIQRLNEVDYEEIFSPETMSLLKKQSKDELVKTGKNLAQMIRTSSTLIPEIIAAERPHIDLLEEIAKEIVTQAYPIIKYSKIKINASIGEGELPKGTPGKEEEEQPNIELPQSTLTGEKKRRIINGITQGASIRGTFAFLMFREYLDDLGEDMVNRYNEVMKSVFGIFDDENAIAMMLALLAQGQKSQGGESEAEFDEETGTLTINATAICFPMLVHEIVKGLYEILSLQGFGTDAEQNKSIVGKADQLAAEPNDMRFGKFIYDAANKLYIESGIEDDRVRDFFFTELYKIDDETEFIGFVENLVTSKLTSAQKKWAMDTMRDIERDLKADDAGIPNDEDGEDVFTEIKLQPGKTGTEITTPYRKFTRQFPNKLNIKLGKYNISGDEPGEKYSWEEASGKLSSVTRNNAESFFNKFNTQPQNIYVGIVYRGMSDYDFKSLPIDNQQKWTETTPNAKSFYIEGNYKDTPIIISRKSTHNPAAGQTYLISPYAKLKFHDVKDLPANEILAALKIPNEKNIKEIKAQPGKTGLKDNRIKLVIQSQTTSPNDNKLYGTLYVDDPESNFPKDSIVYSYEPSTDHMFLSSIRKENFDNLPKMLKNKNIPHEYSDLDIVSGIHVDNLSKYFVLKKNMNEIKVQPVNKKIIKPTKKLKIMPFRSYIDMDASFMEDYILDFGHPIENPIDIKEKDIQGGYVVNPIDEDSFADVILDGDYEFYFGNNLRIDDILELNDPLSIKSFAEEEAKHLSSNHPEDESFYKEEIIRAIEIIQDNIPKYRAAEKILNDKYTIINDDDFSIILWSDSDNHIIYYEMIYKKDGYFNKDGDLVVYLNP